jgi:hypothetical protein
MGDNTSTTTNTSSTAPTNPAVTATTNNLLGKLDAATNAGVPVFNQSLYSPAGAWTQTAWNRSIQDAYNPDFSKGINGALGYASNLIGNGGLTAGQKDLSKQYADLGGAYDKTSDAEQRLRSGVVDTTMQNVNGLFNNSGRFGGGSYVDSLGKGLGDALAGFDTNIYDRNVANKYNSLGAQAGLQQQGVQNAFGAGAALPGYYSALQLPAATMGAVGAAMDANEQGKLLGANDLYQRVNGAPWDTLGRASSILNGTAGASGNTTTSTSQQPQTPWWQSALGLGIGAAGALL